MTQDDKGGRPAQIKPAAVHSGPAPRRAPRAQGELPGWTSGLRQLYDQVVDEEVPESFRDLLARLDDKR